MSGQYPEGSVLAQLEAERGHQTELKAREAVRRTGVQNAAEVFESLSSYEPVQQMRQNQEAFLSEVKRIQNSVELSDAERLEAGRIAATVAATKHQEIVGAFENQVRTRVENLDRTLFGTDDAAMLGSLADLSAEQLATRAALAHTSGNRAMLKAIRSVAHTRGYSEVLERAVAYDKPEISAAYTERQRLSADGVLNALALSYAPPAIEPRSLQTPHHVRQEQERRKRSQEAASERVLRGGGIVDGNHPGVIRQQVGRRS